MNTKAFLFIVSILFITLSSKANTADLFNYSETSIEQQLSAVTNAEAEFLGNEQNASLIIELNSGFIGKIWEIENKFNIDRKAVYYNCKKEKAILTREWKGLNFKKI